MQTLKKHILKYYVILFEGENLNIECKTLYVGIDDVNSDYEVARYFTNFFLRKVDYFTHNKRVKNIIKTDKEIYITYAEMDDINETNDKIFKAKLKEIAF